MKRLKRESGENPKRSGHCKREIRFCDTIGASREGRICIMIRKPGDLLNMRNESFRRKHFIMNEHV